MLPVEQDAQHQRRKSIWRNQSRRFRFQEAVIAAVTSNQQQFGDRQLHKNNAEDEKNSRVLLEALGLIDPKLRNRSGQDQERNDVILRRARYLALVADVRFDRAN